MLEYQVATPIALTEADSMRILLYNVGYCTELDGSMKDYLFRFYRYFYTPKRVTNRAKHSLASMVEAHNPDVCCFVEIRKNMHQMPHFSAYAGRDVENKYGQHGWLRHMPFFRTCCNGFYSQKPLAFKKHWMKNGTKKLFYEIDLGNDTALFFVHMSLRAATRRKQYAEIRKWMSKHKKVILCGDFNNFRKEEDLEAFARDCNLRIVAPKTRGTFPARKPRKAIDLFLCSKDIKLQNIEVLQHVQASDHLPVLLEMKL